MRELLARLRDHAEVTTRRVWNGTFSHERMPGHPERIRRLPDPDEDLAYWDAAEQLLNDGLAEVCERTGWIR